ncbi:CAP domain-containing protein [Duganella callida]|uniref:CAP domain-containing protein n=1 Tax=Duganella callida TaxID=2561932 RepID=A0A4Y9SAY1_9BURK|nr:CAP domain-containing protein [Duganella callida]TFW18855.1 CAP domain-containing protein [Duganella callida]
MKKLILTTAVVSVVLSGCGGGGSAANPSAVSPATPATPGAPAVTPGDTQTSVPPFSYASKSEEGAFATALNDFRKSVGLGLLAQDTSLDAAAANHLSYLLVNDKNNGGTVDFNAIDASTGRSALHIENANLPKFTGIQEQDRSKVTGYTGTYTGEEVTFGGGHGGAAALSTLTQTVYHRAGLMLQNVRELGIAVGADRSQTAVLEMGLKTAQSVSSDYVGVYPSPDQIGVPLHAYVESPNPFPELSTSNSDFPTKTAFPISVSIVSGNTLAVSSFTITQVGQNTPLSTRVMTRSNDPNAYLDRNVAFAIGNAPFQPGTAYRVKFVGTNNGIAFSKEWTFTTQN